MFREEAEKRRALAEKRWLDNVFLLGSELNQRAADYDRGYWFAVDQLLKGPEKALSALERANERSQ